MFFLKNAREIASLQSQLAWPPWLSAGSVVCGLPPLAQRASAWWPSVNIHKNKSYILVWDPRPKTRKPFSCMQQQHVRERKKDIWQKKSWALEMHALIVGIDKMGFKKKISACFKPFFFVSVLNVLFQKKRGRNKNGWSWGGRKEKRTFGRKDEDKI